MNQSTIDRIRKFTADRDCEQFHIPANLAKSIAIEASELLECYQWSDEADIEHVKEELADVLVYCQNIVRNVLVPRDGMLSPKWDGLQRVMRENLRSVSGLSVVNGLSLLEADNTRGIAKEYFTRKGDRR